MFGDFLDELQGLPGPVVLPPLKERVQPLAPQEEESLLGKIASGGLGGLAYAGSVLEKALGGRAIRGLLGGRPREALSIIPFSDTLKITDPAERVSGKELLRLGDDSGWLGTAAGIGAELALDPATYLTFGAGALTRAGQLGRMYKAIPRGPTARATTTLGEHLGLAGYAPGGFVGPMTLGQEVVSNLAAARKVGMDEVLGGVLGIGLPFAKPAVVVGAGPGGAAFSQGVGKAAGLMDTGLRNIPVVGSLYGQAAKGADVVGRYARAVFDPEVQGAVTAPGQASAALAQQAGQQFAATQKQRLAGYFSEVKKAGDESGDILRSVIEATSGNEAVRRAQAATNPQALLDVAGKVRQDLDWTLQRMNAVGMPVEKLTDVYSEYLPRYIPAGKGAGAGPRRPLSATDPRLVGRQSILSDIPGGTSGPMGINTLSRDPLVYSIPADQAAQHVLKNYLAPGGNQQAALQKAEGLVEYLRGLPGFGDAALAGQGRRLFANHPLADLETYYERAGRALGAGEASQRLLASQAVQPPSGAGGMSLQPGMMRYSDALERAGLTRPTGASKTAMDMLNEIRSQQGMAPLGYLDVKDVQVPEWVGKEVGRFMKPFSTPQAVSDIGAAADWLTNLTKAYQTAMWPAFHVRNWLSGLWQNYIKGIGETPGGTRLAYQEAKDLMAGKTLAEAHLIPEYARLGLTPEQATQRLAAEQYALGMGPHAGSLGKEVLGARGGPALEVDLPAFGGRIPGETPVTPKTIWQKTLGQYPGQEVSWRRPDLIQGVSAQKDLFPLVAGGREAGNLVEGLNRGALYYGLRKQGMTAEQAAREVFAAHFNYGPTGKTEAERAVLARLIPFYTFTRGNIPFQLEQMIERPSGAVGSLARVAQDLRQQGGFLPDYLGSGLAIPAGEEQGGTKRFLTRMDLPPEQAFEFLHGGPRWAQNTLLSIASQANPALKGPLEWATGKQFYTGRDLGDLYSATGSATLDQLMANSPFSRAATTLRTLADERKWASPLAALAMPLNLGTGVKLSDVDMAKSRAIAEREFLTETLRGLPEISRFETFYPRVPLGQLSPEELILLRLQKTVEQRAIQQARERQALGR